MNVHTKNLYKPVAAHYYAPRMKRLQFDMHRCEMVSGSLMVVGADVPIGPRGTIQFYVYVDAKPRRAVYGRRGAIYRARAVKAEFLRAPMRNGGVSPSKNPPVGDKCPRRKVQKFSEKIEEKPLTKAP